MEDYLALKKKIKLPCVVTVLKTAYNTNTEDINKRFCGKLLEYSFPRNNPKRYALALKKR